MAPEDLQGELDLSRRCFDALPWLRRMPHLRMDFGRDQGNPFLSEIEPCGDIFVRQSDHLSRLASAYAERALMAVEKTADNSVYTRDTNALKRELKKSILAVKEPADMRCLHCANRSSVSNAEGLAYPQAMHGLEDDNEGPRRRLRRRRS